MHSSQSSMNRGDNPTERTGAARTRTSSFGTSKRESHDASAFYARSIYAGSAQHADIFGGMADLFRTTSDETDDERKSVAPRPLAEWADRIYCHTSENMHHIPDGSVALAFTSPPYNVGKDYDDDMTLDDYLDFIQRVAAEVYRVLQPGGRYVVNIANLGRKPYIPLHAFFYARHMAVGFLPAGEIIWQKGKGTSSSCAWGSWRSAKSPRLRDVHEYLLVFVKEDFGRPDRGVSDIGRDEFLSSTLSVWEVAPESARKVGHPAPFPVELAERVIRLYSYVGDVVLDPFNGSGTTCVAAVRTGRHYVGYDIEPTYCDLAEERLRETLEQAESRPTAPRQAAP